MTELDRLAASAQVQHSPCGDGTLVWHTWGQGRPLLLLHGGSGSWTHWVRNIQPLVDAGRSVWVPDLPGFGDSACPSDCTDADHLPPWLEQGSAQLLGPQPVDVAAFSFGALVAGYWAVRYPARIASLMLVGAPALSSERLPPLPMRFWAGIEPGDRRDAVHRHNLRTLMLAREASIDAQAITLHGANVERDRMRRRRLMLTDALLHLLPQVQAPLAGLWGEQDVLYRGRQQIIAPALALAPAFAGLTLVPEAGHWVQYEAADTFNARLLDWLQSQPAQARGARAHQPPAAGMAAESGTRADRPTRPA